MYRSVAGWATAALLVLFLAESAGANVEAESSYTKAQTYNAALRYLRVDLGYEVTEKDSQAAYLLFHFTGDGKKAVTNGAIEIVEQRDGVKFYVKLTDLPRYREEMLSDGLQQKLHDEYGEPPPRRQDPPRRDRGDQPDGG